MPEERCCLVVDSGFSFTHFVSHEYSGFEQRCRGGTSLYKKHLFLYFNFRHKNSGHR